MGAGNAPGGFPSARTWATLSFVFTFSCSVGFRQTNYKKTSCSGLMQSFTQRAFTLQELLSSHGFRTRNDSSGRRDWSVLALGEISHLPEPRLAVF